MNAALAARLLKQNVEKSGGMRVVVEAPQLKIAIAAPGAHAASGRCLSFASAGALRIDAVCKFRTDPRALRRKQRHG